MARLTRSISNILITLSAIGTVALFLSDRLVVFGMDNSFYYAGDYFGVLVQFLSYQFLHGGLLHFLSNSLFLYLFGNVIERHLGSQKYLLFFLGNTIFVGIMLLFFSTGKTIGISGFAMAILAYYMLELRRVGHPDYKGAFVMLLINVLIGLSGSVSFIGHLAGALWGAVFFMFLRYSRTR